MITNLVTQVVGQPQPQKIIQTVKCDEAECGHVATFDLKDTKKALEDFPWLRTVRVIKTGDGREFLYCEDECEIKAVSKGVHNTLEPKRIVVTDDLKGVNKAAEQLAETDKAIREGKDTSIQVAPA